MTDVEHNLWTVFDAVASTAPSHVGIMWRANEYRLGDLRDQALRLANVLGASGLTRFCDRRDLEPWEIGQDTVATYLLNGPEYLVTQLAAFAASVAPLNVNFRYVDDELAYLLDDARPGAVVFAARFASTLARVLPRMRHRPSLLLQVADETDTELAPWAVDYHEAITSAVPREQLAVDPDDLAVLYTGGTTGLPKGTMWRQADLWASAIGGDRLATATLDEVVAAARARMTRSSVAVPNAPFMHGAAQWCALNALLTGGTVGINRHVDRFDARDVLDLVDRAGAETVLLVGESMARPLLDELERNKYVTSSVRTILTGGATMLPATKRRLLDHFTGARLLDVAGASETGSKLVASSSPGTISERTVFVPRPDVAILDEPKSAVLERGDASVGWFASSRNTPLGYLNDRAKTLATFPTVAGVRWAVPGDRCHWLPDGRIALLGRESVTINSGGEKVFAEEVESVLLAHPAVRDAVVVGVDDARWGQTVVGIVALDPDVDIADVDAHCRRRIASFKVPRQYHVVDVLVRSPAGKADYRWARAVATGEIPGSTSTAQPPTTATESPT